MSFYIKDNLLRKKALQRIFRLMILTTAMIHFLYPAEEILELPPVADSPTAGKRTLITSPEYHGTKVRHQLYLPPDWDPEWKEKGLSWPVIAEYTGNFYPASGSTGEVDGAALGYGHSGGKYIWVVLPCISEDHKKNELTWWGDEKATVNYPKKNIPRICEEFGGDPSRVLLCGFSRGAVAVNYIGLNDDEIASLWCGFAAHDGYDGQMEWKGRSWGSPLEEFRKNAIGRLQRLNGRPVLITSKDGSLGLKSFLGENQSIENFTFLQIPIKKLFPEVPNPLFISAHTDRWGFIDSDERKQVWKWVDEVLKPKPK